MQVSRLPHVDGSGRGLDDGECTYCGSSGTLASEECAVRLRAALDEELADHRATRAAVVAYRQALEDVVDRGEDATDDPTPQVWAKSIINSAEADAVLARRR